MKIHYYNKIKLFILPGPPFYIKSPFWYKNTVCKPCVYNAVEWKVMYKTIVLFAFNILAKFKTYTDLTHFA